MNPSLSKSVLANLSTAAWEVLNRAHVHGQTQVGCAALDERGAISVGCNVEHRYRSHDVHAEVGAISSLVVGGGTRLVAVFIAARRSRFTPCGSCLDWIFEIGDEATVVLFQGEPGGTIAEFTAGELMPHYPR